MAIGNPKVILSFKKGDRGESAYQVAVRNGFTGNEAQWLLSLKGTDGHTPSDGTDGITPVKNVDYFDGKEVEFRKINGYIQWHYVEEIQWRNLIALTDIKGDPGYSPVKGVDYVDGTDGEDGSDGQPVMLQVSGANIQWKLAGASQWINLIALASLKGDPGIIPIKGVDYIDGKSIEIQSTATHIQWRSVGDSVWINLLALSEIKGEDSVVPGPPGTTDYEELSNKPESLSDINSTEGTKLDGIEDNANNYSHPANHAASVITQDASNRFVTDTEKGTWNNKADNGFSIAMAVAL